MIINLLFIIYSLLNNILYFFLKKRKFIVNDNIIYNIINDNKVKRIFFLSRVTYSEKKKNDIARYVSRKEYYKFNFLSNENVYVYYEDDFSDVINPVNVYLVKYYNKYKLFIIRDKILHVEGTKENSQIVLSCYTLHSFNELMIVDKFLIYDNNLTK